jgi:hypothetical protein
MARVAQLHCAPASPRATICPQICSVPLFSRCSGVIPSRGICGALNWASQRRRLTPKYDPPSPGYTFCCQPALFAPSTVALPLFSRCSGVISSRGVCGALDWGAQRRRFVPKYRPPLPEHAFCCQPAGAADRSAPMPSVSTCGGLLLLRHLPSFSQRHPHHPSLHPSSQWRWVSIAGPRSQNCTDRDYPLDPWASRPVHRRADARYFGNL